LGASSGEERVKMFIKAAVERAAEVLFQDDSRAWALVAEALRKRRTLTGDEVRILIAVADDRERLPQQPTAKYGPSCRARPFDSR
jgi:hypothetical protein